ncbi:DUF2637 domain-containing protein [Streptomyces sp. NPDC001739]
MTQPLPRTSPVGYWDRAAIILLGAAGCALSYDALQQMAIAIHVRSWLTYLYPVVIDGFIAYGVRALILSRTAPLRARFYVWALFGTATAASIWANALHAIRLNQVTTAVSGTGLRLGDITVGVLSTLAPLALAGAVHLYILISRHLSPETDHRQPEATRGPTLGQRLRLRLHGRRGLTDGPLKPSARSLRTAERSVKPVHSLSGLQSNTGLQTAPADGPDRTPRSATDEQRTNTAHPTDGPQTNTGPQTTPADGPDRTPRSATDEQRTNTAHPTNGPQTNTGPRESGATGPQSALDRLVSPATEPGSTSGGQRTEQPADGGVADGSKLMPAQTRVPPRTPRADRSADRHDSAADRAATPTDRRTDSSRRARTGPRSAGNPSRTSERQRTATVDRSATPRTAQADRQTDRPVRAQPASSGPVRTRTNSPCADADDISALVPIARKATEREGRINRTVVREGLRAHDIQVSNERMGRLLHRLRSGP